MKDNISDLFTLHDVLSNIVDNHDGKGIENSCNEFLEFLNSFSDRSQCRSGIRILENSDSVTEYVRWYCATTPCADITDCIEALYLHIEDHFCQSASELIDLPTVNHVLNTVEQLFPFFQKAVLANDLSISIVDAMRIGRNGESVAIFDGGNYSGAVFLYRLWNDFDGKVTPAAVLLHELGHQIHFRLTGELRKVPNAFREFLNGIGAHHAVLSDDDLLEVFADTFLLAVISRTREFGDPFPEVDDRTKRCCFEYISSLSFSEKRCG